MRIKTVPEDFWVEEILKVKPREKGPYALYRLEKRNLTTLEAAGRLSARLGLPPSALAFPALKDKRAVAIQHGTAKTGGKALPKEIEAPGLKAALLGFLPRPLSPKDLLGNRFIVTLRDLAAEELPALRERALLIFRQGFPNYFDLQRFGSFSPRLGFPGKLLLLGRWEEVLRAYLSEPLLGDPPAVLRFKKFAREHWGDWKTLKVAAPKGNIRSVLTFLCDHPWDFKRAANLITPRILSLWLSAYQSFLWNRVASAVLRELLPGSAELPHTFGTLTAPCYPMPEGLPEKLQGLEIPLPHAKALSPAGELLRSAFDQVFSAEGLSPKDLRARGLRKTFLSRGSRFLWVIPQKAEILGDEADELFPGQRKLILTFFLPPGSYATLLLRLLGRHFGAETSHS
ncbi:MAG: tRNA pseudouridine(13) synthase TruD [Candidatus Bipolaricaulaceae bacterium]